MDVEQILKRLDWLEKQQRRLADSSSAWEERLAALEREISALSKQAKEKNAQQRELEIVKRHQADLDKINQALADLRKATDVSDIRQQLRDKAIQEVRVTQTMADLQAQVERVTELYEGIERARKAMDETRRTDMKRLAEVQGEVTALRKRMDELRDRMLLNSDSFRVVENRITELLNAEMERKRAQTVFIEQQLLAQAERERSWKEWIQRAEALAGQLDTLNAQIQAAEEALRAAKRAQETYLELNQKLERRINEITEIQRLGEERARQEWAAFKAEDQKRWTAHTLSQQEALNEIRQTAKVVEERLYALDELVQRLQDQLQLFTALGQSQIQNLIHWAHEWLTASEQITAPEKKAATGTKRTR